MISKEQVLEVIEARKAGKKIVKHGQIICQVGLDSYQTKKGIMTREQLDAYLDSFYVTHPCPFVVIVFDYKQMEELDDAKKVY